MRTATAAPPPRPVLLDLLRRATLTLLVKRLRADRKVAEARAALDDAAITLEDGGNAYLDALDHAARIYGRAVKERERLRRDTR